VEDNTLLQGKISLAGTGYRGVGLGLGVGCCLLVLVVPAAVAKTSRFIFVGYL
jgi:hypothetical protein